MRHIKSLTLLLFLVLVFSVLNSLDNPPAHRELLLVRVAVQASLLLAPKELIQAIASNYVLAFTQYNSTFASFTVADVPFIILAMAGDQLSGYSSGSA
ncbi:MAG: hypothetical protein EZS28_032921 [Streblomastix strix]|uniref:Uncharacterized protein n=1 Tax=Streblomastix strix TaxID=222440 RepID=A0A5J4UN06_9EUKA|nr:MAG: hypothetical protein EZS28_032921 [Streblomastix strix]